MTASEVAFEALIGTIDPEVEWTTVGTVDFAKQFGPKAAHAAIDRAVREYPGEVILVPTNTAWADPRRGSPIDLAYRKAGRRRDTRYYYRDAATRWISHVQMHKAICGRGGS